jgi:hypothetical protein
VAAEEMEEIRAKIYFFEGLVIGFLFVFGGGESRP